MQEACRQINSDESITVAQNLNDEGSNNYVIGEINHTVRGSIKRLRPKTWLNDEVANFEMALLNKMHVARCNEGIKYCVFKSFNH